MHIAHLIGILFEPTAHIFGHIQFAEFALFAIANHRGKTVVARHHHIALARQCIEGIPFLSRCRANQLQIGGRAQQMLTPTICIQKLQRHFARPSGIDAGCPSRVAGKHSHRHSHYVLSRFHHIIMLLITKCFAKKSSSSHKDTTNSENHQHHPKPPNHIPNF